MRNTLTQTLPIWLPEQLYLNDYHGNWNLYIDDVYAYFRIDFIDTSSNFKGVPIHIRFNPLHHNKAAIFWHIISCGKDEENRLPDLRRCERIRWIKPIIECSTNEVCIWETVRPYKGQTQRRLNISLPNFEFLVILGVHTDRYDLITAFPIEWETKRKKLEQEYRMSLKKEGSAV